MRLCQSNNTEKMRANVNEKTGDNSMKESDFLFSNCVRVNNQLHFVDTKSGLPAMLNDDISKAK